MSSFSNYFISVQALLLNVSQEFISYLSPQSPPACSILNSKDFRIRTVDACTRGEVCRLYVRHRGPLQQSRHAGHLLGLLLLLRLHCHLLPGQLLCTHQSQSTVSRCLGQRAAQTPNSVFGGLQRCKHRHLLRLREALPVPRIANLKLFSGTTSLIARPVEADGRAEMLRLAIHSGQDAAFRTSSAISHRLAWVQERSMVALRDEGSISGSACSHLESQWVIMKAMLAEESLSDSLMASPAVQSTNGKTDPSIPDCAAYYGHRRSLDGQLGCGHRPKKIERTKFRFFINVVGGLGAHLLHRWLVVGSSPAHLELGTGHSLPPAPAGPKRGSAGQLQVCWALECVTRTDTLEGFPSLLARAGAKRGAGGVSGCS